MHVCLPPLLQEAAPWKVNPLNPEGRLAHVIAHLRHTRIDSALLMTGHSRHRRGEHAGGDPL